MHSYLFQLFSFLKGKITTFGQWRNEPVTAQCKTALEWRYLHWPWQYWRENRHLVTVNLRQSAGNRKQPLLSAGKVSAGTKWMKIRFWLQIWKKRFLKSLQFLSFTIYAAKLGNSLYPSLTVYKYFIRGYEDTIKPWRHVMCHGSVCIHTVWPSSKLNTFPLWAFTSFLYV